MASKNTNGFISSTKDFNTHLKNSEINFWLWDLINDEMRWSKGTFGLFEQGVRDGNMLSDYREKLRPKDEENLIQTMDQILLTDQTTFQFTNRIQTAHENFKWVEVKGEVIRDGKEALALFGVCHDISHLGQQGIELKTIQTQAKIGFWHWTEENGTYWSTAIREIAEMPDNVAAPSFGDWLREYVHPDDRDKAANQIRKGLASKKPAESVHRQRSFKGKEIVVRSICMPSPIEKGKVIGTIQDITAEVNIQNEFQEQSKQFDDILQSMIVGVAKINMKGIITFANDAAIDYLEDSDMIGRHHISEDIEQIGQDGNFIKPEDMPFSRTLATGAVVRVFIHGLMINGHLKWFSVNSAPLMSDGKQVGAIANFVELTEEVEAQKKLKLSEERYRLIAENTGDIITLINLKNIYEYVSPNVFEIIGYTPDEIVGCPPNKFFHEEDLPQLELAEKCVQAGDTSKITHRIRHKNGEYTWHESTTTPVYDDAKNLKHIQNTIHLIHDQKIAEDKLIESETRFRKLIDEAPFSIEIFDRDGTLVISNKQREKLWGLKKGKGIGWYNLYKDANIRKSESGKLIYGAFDGGRGGFTISGFVPSPAPKNPRHLSTRYFSLLDANGDLDNVIFFNEDVTEKVNAEKRLKESEAKFKGLADNLPGLIYMSNQSDLREILYVNDEVKRVTGYSKKDFLSGKVSIASIIHPDDLDFNREKQTSAIEREESFALEYRIQNKSGKWIWVKDTGAGINTESGDLQFVEGYIEDITESKNAFDEIKLNEQRFRILFNDSGHGIGITDDKGIFLEANRRFLELIEYSLDELVAKKSFLDLTHPEDVSIGQDQLIQMMEGKIAAYQVEKRYVSKSKKIIYFRVNFSQFKDPESGELRIVGTADDITETKLAAETIRFNERKFRSLFDNAGNAIVITNAEGLIIELNQQAVLLLGYTKIEAEGRLSIQSITHPEDLSAPDGFFKKLQKGKTRSITSENRYITKMGDTFWAHENISTYQRDASGESVLVRIIEDITERRKFVREIQASELRFRSIFEEAGHGVAISDENGHLITTNKKFRRILGLTKKDTDSKITALDMVHPDYYELAKDQYQRLFTDHTATIQTEAKYITKKKKTIWVRLNGSAYLDPVTNELRLVGIIEDITRRKEALEKVRVSEEFQHETINALSIALMVMKTDGSIKQTNLIWDRLTAKSASLSLAKKGNNFLNMIGKMAFGPRIEAGLSDILVGNSELLEMELALDTKSKKWFALRVSKLKPEFESLVITLQEITVRKRVEQALEESLSKYRNIYNMTPVMMHSIDKNGVLLSVSDFWLEKLGYQRHEVIGKNLREFLTIDSQKDADIVLPVFFQKGSIYDVSYNFITKSGEVLETMLSAIEEGRGTKDARSLAVVTDITPLKRAERQLRKSSYELVEAQHIAKLGNYELDVQSGEFTSSEVFDSILEIGDDHLKTFDLLRQMTPEEDKDYLDGIFKDLFENGGTFEYVGRAITLKTNRLIWLEGRGKAIKEKGKVVRLLGTIQDVTKNKTSEIEIQKLSERLSLATKSAGIGVWEHDLATGVLQFDAQVLKLYGRELPTRKDILEITHPDDRHIVLRSYERLDQGEETIDETRRVLVDEQVKYVRTVIRQIKNEDNRPLKLVGVTMDVTVDQELLHKLESSLVEKDVLIKEVHHRVKNNMQMISSILSLKSLELTDQDSKSVFDDCTTRIKSMAMVHDQLYRFYNVSEIDVSQYLNHLMSGLHSLMGGNAGSFVVDVQAEEYIMNVDQALLCGLIVSEMVANAFKHGFKEMEEGTVNVQFKVVETGKVLMVTNSGAELPENIIEMKSSSLGMSLIKTFVTQLGGTLARHPDNGLQVLF